MTEQDKSTWSKVITGIADSITPENIQRYVLGTKKNGQYRAVYDVVKDYTDLSGKKKKKKKKKGKKGECNTHSLYLSIKGKKGKKKKKGKHFRY